MQKKHFPKYVIFTLKRKIFGMLKLEGKNGEYKGISSVILY